MLHLYIVCDGTEWIDSKGSEGAIERYGMTESKIREERKAMGK